MSGEHARSSASDDWRDLYRRRHYSVAVAVATSDVPALKARAGQSRAHPFTRIERLHPCAGVASVYTYRCRLVLDFEGDRWALVTGRLEATNAGKPQQYHTAPSADKLDGRLDAARDVRIRTPAEGRT